MSESPFPYEPFSIPRARTPSTSRHRLPSEASSIGQSRRPSSVRSMSNFSLAESDTGSRIGRAETADYDRRGRNVRPRESRESSINAPVPAPSLSPAPSVITESATTITDILDSLYVQDIDADEESGNKEKIEFQQECLTVVLEQLFDLAGMAEKISSELGKCIPRTDQLLDTTDHPAEEEMIVSGRLVNRLIDVLRSGVEDTLTSYLKDFVTDGTKSKSKTARQAAWYAKYRATIPGLAGLLKDLTKSDSTTIISLLSQEWSSTLPAFHSEFGVHA
jgi:hypothetical protein